jgi:hypothetical protein
VRAKKRKRKGKKERKGKKIQKKKRREKRKEWIKKKEKEKCTLQNSGIWLGGLRTPQNKKRIVAIMGKIIIATWKVGDAALNMKE